MLFNSFEFPVFLAIVFLLYWFVAEKNFKVQNLLIVAASYVFYGWWDWRFLGLIFFSSICDYFIALAMDRQEAEKPRKRLLFLSLAINLGILGFFKYFNFFIDSFVDTFSMFGYSIDSWTLNIILPVGISFYTFQTLSYTIDVYRKQLKPTKDIVSFFAYVSFFPQLVAGPIERATNLLPQFAKPRIFNSEQARDGLRQILGGLAKKLLIADNCGHIANEIFMNYQEQSSLMLLLGGFFFAFQIYGDFSGYSDVAIGTARLFGFNLMRNFAYPYFSRDIAEFWRRWHISLSTWFRDYLYIPLGGSRVDGMAKKLRNVLVIFVVSGFWHGANWTFMAWGLINGLLFVPLLIGGKNRKYLDVVAAGKWLPSLREILQMGSTFTITCFAWIFFRSESITDALLYIKKIFINTQYIEMPRLGILEIGAYVAVLVLIEWLQRDKQHALDIKNINPAIRWPIYIVLTMLVINGIFGGSEEFIYFQF